MELKCEVLATKKVKFTNEDTRELISGQQLWVCGPSDETAWNGYEVMKIWHPEDHPHAADCASLIHGDIVTVTFNRRGKPVVVNYLG